MIAILTGDIINSRKAPAGSWLKTLKKQLTQIGNTPSKWEIYKGDYFQVEITNLPDALITAIKIKAALKKISGVDVRMAIGIGEKEYSAKRISESNGSAFIFSGETFETLKKEKINIAIKSSWIKFDKEINLYLRLGLIIMDNWSINSAEIVSIALENSSLSQEELGKKIGIKQNAVSSRLKRARYDELKEINEMYKIKLQEFI